MKCKVAGMTVCFALAVAGCTQPRGPVVALHRALSTQPPQVNQVEDAAIWIHPRDLTLSLLLVTNRRRGIEQHDFEGMLIRTPPPASAENDYRGIDVLENFPLGGRPSDLVLVACRTKEGVGVKVWRVDVDRRKCLPVNRGGFLPVLDGRQPLGLWGCRDAEDRNYFFVTDESGIIEQHELIATDDGGVTARRVRRFQRGDKVKAGVADPQYGVFYFAEEESSVWRCPIDPNIDPQSARCIIRVGDHGLTPDIGGLAIYDDGQKDGYLILVSQGERHSPSRLFLYQRQGEHDYVLTLAPAGDDAVYNTSAIAVTRQGVSERFPLGVLAAKNRNNPNASEDFNLYDWRQIADYLTR